uniref:Uncharacterized protein n=1 Tax=Helianthus annuus TaxID=4232 RepID=A0A251UTG8_HELAN
MKMKMEKGDQMHTSSVMKIVLRYQILPWLRLCVVCTVQNLISFFLSLWSSVGASLRTVTCFEELSADYVKGDLHANDLTPALSKALNRIIKIS